MLTPEQKAKLEELNKKLNSYGIQRVRSLTEAEKLLALVMQKTTGNSTW